MLPRAPGAMAAPLLHNSRRCYLSPQVNKLAKRKSAKGAVDRLPIVAVKSPRAAAFFTTSTRKVTNTTDDETTQSGAEYPISELSTTSLSKESNGANETSTAAEREDAISTDSLRTIYLNSPSFISSQTTFVDFLKAILVKSFRLATKISVKDTENVTKEELTAWNQRILKTYVFYTLSVVIVFLLLFFIFTFPS